jgi:hypothetical protein
MALPISTPTGISLSKCNQEKPESVNWAGVFAGGSLIAGGLLLLAGYRRAGAAAAVTGTALTLLDHQETLRRWWALLPGYIDDVQQVLDQVEGTVEEAAAQGTRLRSVLNR